MSEHTIADNLQRLVNARTAIANAITRRGGIVTAGEGFEDFPADIATIPNMAIYGIHIDPNESDPSARVTYLENAVGMTPAYMGETKFNYGSWEKAFFMPKPCVLSYDGTVAYYLDPNDYTKKLDGTPSNIDDLSINGNVMLEFPKIYYKFVPSASGYDGDFYVSNYKVDDSYECWCNYDADNNEIDHFYIGAYNGCCYDGKMRSISGLTLPRYVNTAYSSSNTYAVGDRVNYNNCMYECVTAVETPEEFDATKWEQFAFNGNNTGVEELALARSNNIGAKDEWLTNIWADTTLIWGLLYLIGKSTNPEEIFGLGIINSVIEDAEGYVTGTLNDKGLFYGNVSEGGAPIKVFGIENFWGCKTQRCAGLIGSATNDFYYKLTHGTKDGTEATSFNTNGAGYHVVENGQAADGWIKNKSFGKYGMIAKVVDESASSTTYYCSTFTPGKNYCMFSGSYSSNPGNGTRVALSGGVNSRSIRYSNRLSCKPLSN